LKEEGEARAALKEEEDGVEWGVEGEADAGLLVSRAARRWSSEFHL
jgi:hypothetical protein